MMLLLQTTTSILSSSSSSSNPISISPTFSLSISHRLHLPSPNPCIGLGLGPSSSSSSSSSSLGRHFPHRRILSYLHSTATEETVEVDKTESKFIEIGYISGVHGLQGEVRVKPNTDFPDLRFSEPGRRWLRQQVFGKEQFQEVGLVEGRGHHGQKSWIVRFHGVDTVDQAQHLVGSTILVPDEDRPELEEGEFYTHDLVGMRVILKETGESVGTVVNVYNSGANDLLHVMLDSSPVIPDGSGETKSSGASPTLVWVPFVEAIVPNVDMHKREMLLTPPKGLLELNVRSDDRSKKERRQIEWKERKKFQQRLTAARKKLCDLEQQHVFDGFKCGEKAQGNLLADQIVAVNSILLKFALQSIKITSKRWNASEFIRANLTEQKSSTFQTSNGRLIVGGDKKPLPTAKLQERGQLLSSEGKVAIVLVVDDIEKHQSDSGFSVPEFERTEDSPFLFLQTLLHDNQRLMKIEHRVSVPLVLVCPAHAVDSLQQLFSINDHFAFDSEKVWFLEEEKLPVISCLPNEQNKPKILMKSPWEILQTPVGSGGVFSLLSSSNILEKLSEMGVEFIKVCSVDQQCAGGDTLLGLVSSSSEANVGIKVLEDSKDSEERFDMVFSMKFLKQLTKQIEKLEFHAIPNRHSHVEKVDEEWVDVNASSPNSFELRSSIYSSLNASPPNKVCVMEVTN